jgi:hypothetical protein
MERNGKQVGCDAHDNNALVVRGSGSNRLVSMEREREKVSFYSFLFFSSFRPFLLVGAGFGLDQTRTKAMEDLLQLGAPPPPPV